MEGTRSGPPPRAGPARPLLAASVRPRLAAVLTGCAILVAALGALFAGQSTADSFDRAVDSPVITLFAGHGALALWLALARRRGPLPGPPNPLPFPEILTLEDCVRRHAFRADG
jgi:peptidoglycan/LPS O-acetylase OafA/YrhL